MRAKSAGRGTFGGLTSGLAGDAPLGEFGRIGNRLAQELLPGPRVRTALQRRGRHGTEQQSPRCSSGGGSTCEAKPSRLPPCSTSFAWSSGGLPCGLLDRNLTLTQREECGRLGPKRLGVPGFLEPVLARLAPTADEVPRHDPASRHAQLACLGANVGRLPSAFNSLEARVPWHRLAHDLAAGQPDLELFQVDLKPRGGRTA